MKGIKEIIAIGLLGLALTGCGVTQGETGDDGANGANGTIGRSDISPIARDVSITSDTVTFTDVVVDNNAGLLIHSIDFRPGQQNVLINIPSADRGSNKSVKVVVNGNVAEFTLSTTQIILALSIAQPGTDSAVSLYKSTWSEMDKTNRNEYVALYVDDILKEFYWLDSFQ